MGASRDSYFVWREKCVAVIYFRCGMISDFIMWLLPPEWKTRIHSWLRRAWQWVKRIFRHKETPEEAEERRLRKMIFSDDSDIWTPLT